MRCGLQAFCVAAFAFVFFSTPASAYNDWYRIGYSQGYLQKEREAQQLASENQRLREELSRLKQVAARGSANTAAPQQLAQVQYQSPGQVNRVPGPGTLANSIIASDSDSDND
jgi:hypothetical protein